MATTTDELCFVCASIDLKEYFRREIHAVRSNNELVRISEDAIQLGDLGAIGERSESCSFCRLIVATVLKLWGYPASRPRQELADVYRREDNWWHSCHLFSYLHADNRGPNAALVDLLSEERDSQRAYRIGIDFRLPYYSREIRDEKRPWGQIQLSAISAAQYGMPKLCHGRVIDSRRVNMALASNWLSDCETHHKQRCSAPDLSTGGSASPASPRDLLVVDVLLMNLCRMPHGSRYMTLSYRWPELNTFVTTKSILTKLFIPGALRDNRERIIPTIQDAIQCVSDLGERYLWVDALCIIQDDEEHKSSQIQQMDLVYECSLLTIIHAPSDMGTGTERAHNGLVGYRKGSRRTEQNTFQVQGMELLVPFPDVNSVVIFKSRWADRAWTYQEERLSRRRLYFTETQMYFQCSCAVFCEDAVGEGIDPSAFIYPATNLWNSSGRYSLLRDPENPSATWLSRSPIDDPAEALAAYSRSLAQFSRREMSDPKDAIASFEGILSVFRESLKTDFCFGLPKKYLDESLLWIVTGCHSRRSIWIGFSNETIFPSWSWAGWDTKVELGSVFTSDISPEVEWFVISQSGEAIQLVTHGSYKTSAHPRITASNRNVRPPATLPDDFLKTVQDQAGISEWKKWEFPRFLACCTCIASFGISNANMADTKLGEWEPVIYRERFQVFDNVRHWAGSVFMGLGWQRKNKGYNRTFEFMLLSRSNTLNGRWVYYDEDVFTYREWCFLNVMLIKRDGDRAQRVGIGMIHEDAWVEANPVSMLIKLE